MFIVLIIPILMIKAMGGAAGSKILNSLPDYVNIIQQ
jgi:hypothetical protein